MYRPMTAIEVAARYAELLHSDGTTSTVEQTTHSQMELVGVPVRGLTRRQMREPGSAPSRLNAYAMRELAVTDAMPQKNCATTQMNSRNLPSPPPAASMKICAGGKPVADWRSAVKSWIAHVTANSSRKPATSDTTTELTMPRGAATAASWVSSDTCALASYPVNVYWAISRPSRNAYTAAPVPVRPVEFLVSRNTSDRDLWWSGTNSRTTTMTPTPARCHQALTSDNSLTRLTPNVLSSPCAAMMTAKTTNVLHLLTGKSNSRLRNAVVVSAAP